MANSTHVLTDSKTLATGTPTAASYAQNSAKDNLDLVGMAGEIANTAAELNLKLTLYVAATASADPQNTLAASILATVS